MKPKYRVFFCTTESLERALNAEFAGGPGEYAVRLIEREDPIPNGPTSWVIIGEYQPTEAELNASFYGTVAAPPPPPTSPAHEPIPVEPPVVSINERGGPINPSAKPLIDIVLGR